MAAAVSTSRGSASCPCRCRRGPPRAGAIGLGDLAAVFTQAGSEEAKGSAGHVQPARADKHTKPLVDEGILVVNPSTRGFTRLSAQPPSSRTKLANAHWVPVRRQESTSGAAVRSNGPAQLSTAVMPRRASSTVEGSSRRKALVDRSSSRPIRATASGSRPARYEGQPRCRGASCAEPADVAGGAVDERGAVHVGAPSAVRASPSSQRWW